jgi:[acyl-carrier-protein] S-malonyltransferase
MVVSTAWIFPGQGSQVVGMGRDLYAASPAARQAFDMADAALGFGLAQLCFEGPEEQLTATENAQPALLATCIALLAALAERDSELGSLAWEERLVAFVEQRAAYVAGHSLGEYSALVAAGAIDYMTALRLVRRRGELMSEAREGAMAAVLGADELVLEEACRAAAHPGELVVVANYNAPGQLVISGAAAAVERAGQIAKAKGAKRSIPLKVSAAFHSPLMRSAADGLRAALEAAPIRDARVPVLANVSGVPIEAAADVRAELAAQVTAPVRWIAMVQYMAAAGADRFVEVGPGAVLAGLVRRIAPGAALVNIGDHGSVEGFDLAR